MTEHDERFKTLAELRFDLEMMVMSFNQLTKCLESVDMLSEVGEALDSAQRSLKQVSNKVAETIIIERGTPSGRGSVDDSPV